jgi:hypothetical protein
MACSFPCLDGSFPSIVLWYGLTIAICAAFGAKLGPGLLRVKNPSHASAWPGTSFIHESHQCRPAHIARLNPFDPEAGILNQFADCTIEMAPAAKAAPNWRKMILPQANARVR